MRALLSLFAATVTVLVGAQPQLEMFGPGQILRVEKTGYVLLPATAVASGFAQEVCYAGDGKGLLIVRTDPRGLDRYFADAMAGRVNAPPAMETVLTWVDLASNTSKDLWRGPIASRVEAASPNGASFVAVTLNAPLPEGGGSTSRVLLAQVSGVKVLLQADSVDGEPLVGLQSQLAPDRSRWAVNVLRTEAGRLASWEVHSLDRSGRFTTQRLTPPDGTSGGWLAGWSRDSTKLWVSLLRTHSGGRSNVAGYVAVRPDSGTEGSWTEAPPKDLVAIGTPFEEEGELVVDFIPAQAKAREQSITTGVTVLSSRSGKESSVLFHGMARPILSPKGDSVVLAVPGAVLLRKILLVDVALLDAQKEAAEKAVLVSNSKQVGLAAILYASDHDDVLPGPDGIKDLLMPYLKNERILEGFVYVFVGGPMSKIEKPTETVLGYIPGKGGRAVVYADGHVKWVPDP